MLTVYPGGMAGRFGNIAWQCGADATPDIIDNILAIGCERFGYLYEIRNISLAEFDRWMAWLCRL